MTHHCTCTFCLATETLTHSHYICKIQENFHKPSTLRSTRGSHPHIHIGRSLRKRMARERAPCTAALIGHLRSLLSSKEVVH